MSVRILVLAAILFTPLVRPLLVPFGAMTIATLAAAAFCLHRGRAEEAAAGEVALKNPFSLTAAVKFGLVFAAVLLVVAAVERYLPGGRGYYLVAAVAGLTDVDAITLSMVGVARNGAADLGTVVGAIVVAALANTVVKCGMVVATASPGLRRSIVTVTVCVVLIGVATVLLV
jgi:uncharacterized membrane protein (DUF4010 family)